MRFNRLRRVIATCACLSFMAVDASAVVKEVMLWGVRSINDMGSSDRLITMEELQADYSGYLQTDGMTEYFHKDQEPSPKEGMTEALSWLIDNGIINRDETITVSNINSVPSVSIVKADINSKLFYPVQRSDALMYIYKSVFGPLSGRTVGVETPTVRSDEESLALFTDIVKKYQNNESNVLDGENLTSSSTPGENGIGVGAPGGNGGSASSDASYTNDAKVWRYTPQGDAYTSVFGDTNVFISENHFNQESTGGAGGDGGTGVSGGAFNAGSGGDGGDGGDSSNTINYETDYKQVYFVPGSDVLFYRTDDVVERYLQALLSKGLLETDNAVRTARFQEEFSKYTTSNASIAPWSGEADPFVVNLSVGKHIRVENVAYSSTSNVLGVNFSVRNNSDSLTITRHNLFESDTGYFATEDITRMGVYRYIYTMVYASEKKMSDLERDLVNYKYGMEFDGIASKEDAAVLKYLIAKGILSYDSSDELSNLYASISWYDLVPILYRVANKDARLNFTAIQLTDSEQSWKAKGFSPQTVHLVSEGTLGDIYVTLDEDYVIQSSGDQDTSPIAALASLLGIVSVNAAPEEIGSVTYRVENSGAMTFNGFYFDYSGAIYDDDAIVQRFSYLLGQLDKSSSAVFLEQTTDGYNSENPKHIIVGEILKNIYVISRIQTSGSLYRELSKVLTTWGASKPAAMDSETYTLKRMVAGYFENMLECAGSGKGTPVNIKFVMTDGTVNNVPNPSGGGESFARSLKSIRFGIPSTDSGTVYNYTYEFQEDSAGALIDGGTSVAAAVNKAAVEFSKRFTEAELQSAGGTEELGSELAQQLGSAQVTPSLFSTSGTGNAFVQQVDPTGKDAFVSWASIEAAMGGASEEIPLVKVSDTLLYNTQTDTYAYFSYNTDGRKSVALVGTAVVTGDSDLGVVFKSGEGESAVLYYHVNAIRLLLDAGQEDAVVGGVRGLSLPDGNFSDHVSSVDLISESGVSESKIAGVKCLISRDYSADSGSFGSNTAFGKSTVVGNSVWGTYLSLSQANRVMNIITRRVQYESAAGQSSTTAYAVVRFIPVDAEELGTVAVDGNTSLQDLLDAPAQPPTDTAAKQVWTSNKAACNAYANWIYGTSNITYIETGYVRPEASLYILGDASSSMPPASLFTPLTDTQRAAVSVVPMGKVTLGAVAGISETPTVAMRDDSARRCMYWMASDCSAIVSGDRLYLHDSLFTNLSLNISGTSTYARITNSSAKIAAFTPGATFKVAGVADILSNGIKQPSITVIETEDDGTVKCQVGPIGGMPISLGNKKVVVNASGTLDDVKTLSAYDFIGVSGDDRLTTTFYEMFKAMPGVINLGISSEPVLKYTGSANNYVFTGSKLNIYESVSKPVASVTLPTVTSDYTLADCAEAFSGAVSKYTSASPVFTNTYINIEFPAYSFSVKDGKLQYQSSTATEFLSPSLFSSLNDLIIDEMINESNGAIPVNEIPEGALLKLGNCYYQAVGSSTDSKSFVGYAYITSVVGKATLQDAAPAFASQLVRAGNQYVNVSHWFAEGTTVLGNASGPLLNALTNVASQTLMSDKTAKRSVDSLGNVEIIVPSNSTASGSLYCPVKIVFSEGLYAYKVSSPSSSDAPRYALCTSAESAISGVFSDIPFFTNRVLDAELYDQTTDLLSAMFNRYEGASGLMAKLQEQFQKAFAGDLVTLARMIVFIILCWLVIASWLCYVCRISNLLPILEAIRYPTGNKNSKGLDLFKVVSLGTISLDTQFGLGRFIQYEAILACLLCVVMLTGKWI